MRGGAMRDIIGRSELLSKGRRVGRIVGRQRSARVRSCGAARRRFSWRVGRIVGMRWSARVRSGVRRCAAAVFVAARWAYRWKTAVGARARLGVRRCAAAVFMAARWAHCWNAAVGARARLGVRRCVAAVFVAARWACRWKTAVGVGAFGRAALRGGGFHGGASGALLEDGRCGCVRTGAERLHFWNILQCKKTRKWTR